MTSKIEEAARELIARKHLITAPNGIVELMVEMARKLLELAEQMAFMSDGRLLSQKVIRLEDLKALFGGV